MAADDHAGREQGLVAAYEAAACQAGLTDHVLRGLPLIGAVDQELDTTDVLSDAARSHRYRSLRGIGGAVAG